MGITKVRQGATRCSLSCILICAHLCPICGQFLPVFPWRLGVLTFISLPQCPMRNALPFYSRLALRESRRSRGRIGLFMGCIAVGVAAIVVVQGVSTSVREGVRAEGRRLMAADVLVESRRPLPPELDDVLAKFTASTPGKI